MSLRDGFTKASDQNKYRSSHDARIAFGVIHEKTMMLPSETFTYGRANRVQTPVNGIIANNYGEEAGIQQQRRYFI
jgi:hypothetical protein